MFKLSSEIMLCLAKSKRRRNQNGDYYDHRDIFHVIKKSKYDERSMNAVQIRKDDVDVLKFKTRCDCSDIKKLTTLKFSPELCGVTLILIPN